MSSVEIVEKYPRLVDFVLSDHVHVHVLYKQLVASMAGGPSPLVSKLCNAIMLLVRQHSQAELDVLYPAMESDLGPMGKSLSEKALDEHAQVEEMVKQALEAGVESKEAAQIVKQFCDLFFVHAEEEEKEMVPALIAKEPEAKQEQLVQQMIESKANAPFEPQMITKET